MGGLEEDYECVYGKNGRTPRTRVRKLISTKSSKRRKHTNGEILEKDTGEFQKVPILHRTLGNSYWRNQGLKSLQYRYETLRHHLN